MFADVLQQRDRVVDRRLVKPTDDVSGAQSGCRGGTFCFYFLDDWRFRRIDEQLSYIARVVGVEGANDWSEETKRLQSDRINLLALRKQVLQEPGEITAGTNEAG